MLSTKCKHTAKLITYFEFGLKTMAKSSNKYRLSVFILSTHSSISFLAFSIMHRCNKVNHKSQRDISHGSTCYVCDVITILYFTGLLLSYLVNFHYTQDIRKGIKRRQRTCISNFQPLTASSVRIFVKDRVKLSA